MTIRCIAFDLDDTFWDCKSVINNAEQQLYNWLATHTPAITQHYSESELISHRMGYMKQRPELHHDLGALRREWLQVLADQFALEHDWIKPAFERFLEARNQVQLFPGVQSALESLNMSYKLGTITNGNADIHRIGLGHLFHFTHNSADAGVAKPDPLIFQQALEMAGVKPHEMVYVGDDPERDIIGANHAGLRTIWYNPSSMSLDKGIKPDAIMTNYNEIAKLVGAL